MTKQEFLTVMKSYLTSDLSNSPYHSIDYWYPLQKIRDNIPVVAFNLDMIYKDCKINQIESVLCQLSIDVVTVIQNQEHIPDSQLISLRNLLYEADEDGYNFPWYVESYYYDDSKQWMIYTSHESTIAFAGEELVRIAKQTIDSKYLERRYTTVFPYQLDGAHVLYYTDKDDYGQVTNPDGSDPQQICYLAICKYEKDNRYYLFFCDNNYQVITDDLWDSIDECLSVACSHKDGIEWHRFA